MMDLTGSLQSLEIAKVRTVVVLRYDFASADLGVNLPSIKYGEPWVYCGLFSGTKSAFA